MTNADADKAAKADEAGHADAPRLAAASPTKSTREIAESHRRIQIQKLRLRLKGCEASHDYLGAERIYHIMQTWESKDLVNPAVVAELVRLDANEQEMARQGKERLKQQKERRQERKETFEALQMQRQENQRQLKAELADAVKVYDYKTARLLYKQLATLKARPLVEKEEQHTCFGDAVHADDDDEIPELGLELVPESVIAGTADGQDDTDIMETPLSELLDEDELQSYRDCFRKLGLSQTGEVDQHQFGQLMTMIAQRSHNSVDDKIELDDDELNRVFKGCDSNGDGFISFDEFCRAIAKASVDSSDFEVARLAFDALDNDGDRHIQSEELVGFMMSMHTEDPRGNVPALVRAVSAAAPRERSAALTALDLPALQRRAAAAGVGPAAVQAALAAPPITEELADLMIEEAEHFYAVRP